MMFTNDVRKDVRLDHPDTSVSDRAKIIGRMWSEFEETKKKVRGQYKLQNLTILAPLCKLTFHVHTILLLGLIIPNFLLCGCTCVRDMYMYRIHFTFYSNGLS